MKTTAELNNAAIAEFQKRAEMMARYHDYLATAGSDPMSYKEWKDSIAKGEIRSET